MKYANSSLTLYTTYLKAESCEKFSSVLLMYS